MAIFAAWSSARGLFSMSGEKTFDATDHKVEEAREDGNVAISQDLMKSAVCLVAFEVCRVMAMQFDGFVFAYFTDFISQLANVQQHRGFRADNIFMWIGASVALSLMIGCVSVLVFITMSWVQTGGPVIKKSPIEFKLDGFLPDKYFKKVFALKTLVDLATNIIKALVISAVLWFAVKEVVRQLPMAVPSGIEEVSALIAKEALGSVRKTLVILFVMSVGDFWIQRKLMLKDLKMSMQDMKDEHKQMEGSPESKQNVRAFAEELMSGSDDGGGGLGGANVLVVNPTHVAVGLRYVHGERRLPRIRALAIDKEAMRFIEIAKDTGIPVVRHIWLARTLYSVKAGEPIPREAYRAIAAIYRLIVGLEGITAGPQSSPVPPEMPKPAL
ncbi:EscU/YscU/HrcU family type III secretion system export apparatus switch protein [Variovorax sp. RHLX14]|uniref:EscU/YscU/HrcU family type III secretion system export apparatus switch protein n=1 Tax=Variovorax sp. RHLX14 TaxID=1259731 RepID=UPI003F47F803